MKKKLLTAALLTFAALTLVVVTVFVTIAYLTASSAVSNVFTVGEVAIEMYETKVNSDGTPTDIYQEDDKNSYHLVPGQKYTKDPTIRIKSKLEQDKMYLFVKSSNQIRTIEAGNQPGVTDEVKATSMREQMEANGWVEYIRSGDGIEIVWVYGTRDVTTGIITPIAVGPETGSNKPAIRNNGEFVFCENFTVASDANVSIYAAAKVNFTAFAIQNTGVETVQKAWEAIKETYPYEGGIVSPVNPYNGDSEKPYDPVPGEEPIPIS